MDSIPPDDRERRILVVAPMGRDAALVEDALRREGMTPRVCTDLANLIAQIEVGAGAVLIAEEILTTANTDLLLAQLGRQPQWSDLPVLLLARRGAESGTARRVLRSFTNVTLIERPTQIAELTSAARTALGARSRQYQIRDHLLERELAAEALRRTAERLQIATEAGGMGTFELDLKTGEAVWSDAAFELLGTPVTPGNRAPYEIWRRQIHPDDRHRLKKTLDTARAARSRFAIEYRLRPRADGSIVHHSALGRFVYDHNGEAVRSTGVFFDITRRNETEQELRRSEAILTDFFDNATVGLRWEGPDGVIVRANNAELELLGYARDEYVGHRSAEFHVSPAVAADLHARLKSGEKVRGLEAQMRCRNGDIKDVVLSASVLWEDGRFVRSRCFTQDITERKKSETLLRESAARLREADRRKDEFLAMLAHELRNPLGPVSHAAALLRLNQSSPDLVEKAANIIDRQVRHVGRLVDDLLDVSRITSGKIKLRMEPVALSDLIARLVQGTESWFAERGQRLDVICAPDLVVLGDATRLYQIVSNLLHNASKYTAERVGRIELSVTARDGNAVILVKDNGIGIEKELLADIFGLFTQLDASIDRSAGGLGIGLTVARKLAGMHGATVAAASEGPGRGSEFTLELPLLRALPATATLHHEAETGVRPRAPPRRVLVVDDNVDAADVTALILGASGHEVTVAYDGVTALERARTTAPDVVLLDIGLPGKSGYEVARALRKEAGLERALLVAITGYGRAEDRAECIAAGFDHHFVKPVDTAALLGIVAGAPVGQPRRAAIS